MKHITITGNVGKFEKRFTANQTPVLNFTVGVYNGKNQDGTTNTLWFSCAVMGKQVENLATNMFVGARVTCMGDLAVNYYAKADGSQAWNLKLDFANCEIQSKNTTPITPMTTQSNVPVPTIPATSSSGIPF